MTDLRKNLVERRFIELDPSLAKHYLTFNTFAAQREVKDQHLQELSDKIIDGRFRFGEIAFAYMSTDNQENIMMNGQHICHAVIQSGITIPCVMEKFQIDSERDMSELFRQFEIMPRSLKDMVRVEAHSLGLKWPVQIAGLVVSAATIDTLNQRRLDRGGSMTKEQKTQLLIKYVKEGSFVNGILTGSDSCKHLRRSPVACVMFWTFRKSQSDSTIFWARVRDGENLTRIMPEMKLREFLMSVNSLVASNKYTYRRVMNHEFIYKSVLAWNSFRTGKPTNLAYRPEAIIPKVK